MAVCPNGHDSASDDFCDVCGMRIGGSPHRTGPAGGAVRARSALRAAGPRPPDTRSGPAARPVLGASASTRWPGLPAGPLLLLARASADEPCPRCGTARSGQFSAKPAAITSPARLLHRLPGPSAATAGPGRSAPPCPAGGSAGPPVCPLPALGPLLLRLLLLAPPDTRAAAPPSMSSFPYPQATWTAVVGADRAYYERVQAVTGPEGAAVASPPTAPNAASSSPGTRCGSGGAACRAACRRRSTWPGRPPIAASAGCTRC